MQANDDEEFRSNFLIEPDASLSERRTQSLKHGDTFAVFDQSGDISSTPGNPQGIFHRDTRHLSLFCLTVCSKTPILLSSTLWDDNALLTCDLTNPEIKENGKITFQQDILHLRRYRFLWNAICYERLVLRNFDDQMRHVRLKFHFDADFCDLFEVRGAKRAARGVRNPAEVGRDWVTLGYTGLDGKHRATTVRFAPQPDEITAGVAIFDIDVPPKHKRTFFLEIDCNGGNPGHDLWRAFFSKFRDARRAMKMSVSRAASIATSNEVMNEGVRRAVSDLYTLITETPEGPYPYAGIPWFSTVFGRDALVTALETLWLDPSIARGVLRYLAANQAQEEDPAADAEPGKILHEVRYGEMAELGEVPFRRYYGSIDSTPLFVMLAGAYYERTDDLETIQALWPHVDAALGWIEKYGDCDGDGFVEYGRRTSEGLVNQGWKDSYDSVFHADGSLARGPIAVAEVQAYVFAAWTSAAVLARRLQYHNRAAELEAAAASLRRQFDQVFFDSALGTYILALDGDKRPCRVLASNAGYALYSGIAMPDRAQPVVDTLMSAALFSGWGIRTVGTAEARFNPMSYHNGSVWPHDNAIIAEGFARYGFRREAVRVFEGLFDASTHIDMRRLPELFCGFGRHRSHGPTHYPVACSPQAWAAGAPLSLIQTCLGLRFDPAAGQIIFQQPMLPEFMDEVTLRGLSLPNGSVDVSLRRAGQEVVAHVLERTGEVSIVTIS